MLPVLLAGMIFEHIFRALQQVIHPLTVFLPSSPNPGSGTVMVVESALLGDLKVPAHRVFQCMSGWGHGAKALLSKPH